MVTVIALSGTFEWLTIFANLAALSLYFLCAIATLFCVSRNVRSDGEPFVIPGGPLVPVCACVASPGCSSKPCVTSSIAGITQLYALLMHRCAIVCALYGAASPASR